MLAAQILFCGGSLVAEKDGLVRCSRGMNSWNETKAKEPVKIEAALGATIICSGHGWIVREAPNKFLSA